MGEGNCARAGMATRSLRVERADALSDVSYRNYASDQSRAQISRNLGAMHSAAVSNPLPTPYPPPPVAVARVLTTTKLFKPLPRTKTNVLDAPKFTYTKGVHRVTSTLRHTELSLPIRHCFAALIISWRLKPLRLRLPSYGCRLQLAHRKLNTSWFMTL